MAGDIFIEVSIIVFIAIIISAVMRLLKQPLIIGYIITGLIVSPYGLNLLKSAEEIETFAHIGIVLLLFLVGLNLNPKVIKEVGGVSLITGLGQVVFTSIIGFIIAKAFGFSTIPAIYIAIALTFSSTIIILKLLSDKQDLDKLYGKISVGFLIVQDFVAMFILILLPPLARGGEIGDALLGTLGKGIAIAILLVLTAKYILPKILEFSAKSQEFLFLFSIGWCLIVAAGFYVVDFSMEVGALLAGMMLSAIPYRIGIAAKLRPLRDFFLVMFFIMLGSQMTFGSIEQHIIPIIILSLFVLIGNPLIVMVLMGILGYTKRTGFLAGLTVAQISEFSLIVVALGVTVGHVTTDILSFVTIIGLITIAGSSYMITFADKIYPHIAKYLSIFERKTKAKEDKKLLRNTSHEVIIFGSNRIGRDVLQSFKKNKKKVLVIDYNPEVIETIAKQGYDAMYGDASDPEFMEELKLTKAKMIISTISDIETDIFITRYVHSINPKAIIILVSPQSTKAIELYNAGATYVIMPHFLGGHHASNIIEKNKFNKQKFKKEKEKHLAHLTR